MLCLHERGERVEGGAGPPGQIGGGAWIVDLLRVPRPETRDDPSRGRRAENALNALSLSSRCVCSLCSGPLPPPYSSYTLRALQDIALSLPAEKRRGDRGRTKRCVHPNSYTSCSSKPAFKQQACILQNGERAGHCNGKKTKTLLPGSVLCRCQYVPKKRTSLRVATCDAAPSFTSGTALSPSVVPILKEDVWCDGSWGKCGNWERPACCFRCDA